MIKQKEKSRWIEISQLVEKYVPQDEWHKFFKNINWSEEDRNSSSKYEQYHYKISEILTVETPFTALVDAGQKKMALAYYNSLPQEEEFDKEYKSRMILWFKSIVNNDTKTLDWLLENKIAPVQYEFEKIISVIEDKPHLWERMYQGYIQMTLEKNNSYYFEPWMKVDFWGQIMACGNEKLMDFFLNKNPDFLIIYPQDAKEFKLTPTDFLDKAISDAVRFSKNNCLDNIEKILTKYNLWSDQLLKSVSKSKNNTNNFFIESIIRNHEKFTTSYFKKQDWLLSKSYKDETLEVFSQALQLINFNYSAWLSCYYRLKEDYTNTFPPKKDDDAKEKDTLLINALVNNFFNFSLQEQMNIFKDTYPKIREVIHEKINAQLPSEYKIAQDGKFENIPELVFEKATYYFKSTVNHGSANRSKTFKIL